MLVCLGEKAFLEKLLNILKFSGQKSPDDLYQTCIFLLLFYQITTHYLAIFLFSLNRNMRKGAGALTLT